MDIKWINTRKKRDKSAPPAEKGSRGRGIKAVCGFLAFFLGVSLLAESGLFFVANLGYSNGRQRILDSLQEDYRNTQSFRNYVSDQLDTLITMGAGGRVYNSYYGYGYDDGYDTWWSGETQPSGLHAQMKEDKNLLYTVAKGDKVLYTNHQDLSAGTTSGTLPEHYSFLLQFDGARVRIWQDTEELSVYGDGYYDYEKDGQWYVPGYDNFGVDENAAQIQVTIAVIDHPKVFVKGNYGRNGTQEYNYLYYLQRNLQQEQQRYLTRLVYLSVGVLLIALYIVLRKDKKRADQALARGTGRMWFEAKLIVFLILLVCLLPRFDYLNEIWYEMGYAYGTPTIGPTVVADLSEEAAEMGWEIGAVTYSLSPGDAVNALANEGGRLFLRFMYSLASSPIPLLIKFWGFYLLLFNDWRYCKKSWRHGIFGMIAARELKYPIQKRLSRMGGITGLAFGLILLVAGYLFVQTMISVAYYSPIIAWMMIAACAVGLTLLTWTLTRQRSIWTDLGALSDQIAHLRSGQIDMPLELSPDHDLYQAADDLNHVQQGLHQAVEERTRSERMKVELVTNVSHDLKTPLTSIISYTELLAQEPLEPPASEYVQILNEKSQRLKAMVQDVFEVSKAASGQLPVKLEMLDFGRLLRQTLADMAQSIESSGLTLRTTIPEEPVPISADSDRMYRVFQNLIANALKYSLPGSRVYLTLTVEEGQATASVKNASATELTLDADYTGRFVRGDGSRTDGGSGLGLSIADSFTRACGGALTVATEADLFTACVTFPLAQ